MSAAGLGACSFALDLQGPAEAIVAADQAPAPGDADLLDARPTPDGTTPDPDGGAAPDACALACDAAAPETGPRPDQDPSDADATDAAPPDADQADAAPVISPPELVFESGTGLTLTDAVWDAVGLRPNGPGPGRLRSGTYRLAPGQRWQWLDHQPLVAYGTPLHGVGDEGTDGGAGFAGTPVDAADARLLLHFEEAAVVPDAFAQSAGTEVAQAFYRNGVSAVAEAPFGQGVAVVDGAAVHLNPSSRAFQFEYADFTWAAFVRTAGCPRGNNVYLGGQRAGQNTTHLWLGCLVQPMRCPEGRGVGGTVRASNGVSTFACGPAFDDDRWHHLAVTKRGHNPATVTWYLDGQPVASSAGVSFGEGSLSLDDSQPWFGVGDFPSGDYAANGAVDEVAIWHRALSDGALQTLADRGLARVEVWARRCRAARCDEATEPFVRLDAGPGVAAGWRRSALPEGDGDFVQFEVVLDRSAGGGPRVLGLRLLADSD